MVLLSLLRPGGRKNKVRKRPAGQGPDYAAGGAPPPGNKTQEGFDVSPEEDGGVWTSLITLLVLIGGMIYFGPKLFNDYVKGPPPADGECRLRDCSVGWIFTQYDFGDCSVVRVGPKDKRLGIWLEANWEAWSAKVSCHA